MDIKLTDKALRKFLNTSSTPEDLSQKISQCGPTFDKTTKIGDDYLYEIEIITNRIDSASAQGVARESSAILNQMGITASLKNDPYLEVIDLYESLPKTFSFEITDPSLAPRFTAVSLENISVKESPKETQELLNICGERPINNVVDITNELTLLYGMPSHIFDLDKLAVQNLLIRESKENEEVTTLDHQKNKLKGGDIIIEDGAGRIVDLCGVMGGSVAEVDDHTKNILLIVPVYHANKIRRTSLYLQKRTLASQIYEKQPDPELCLPVLMKAIQLFKERADAKVSSRVFDSFPNKLPKKSILLNLSWTNKLIGIEIPRQTVTTILDSLGFTSKDGGEDQIICTVPSWRTHDINIKEDLVEEIARVYNYSKLPPIIPSVNLSPEKPDPVLQIESKIKNFLSIQGFNEVYNNSLISKYQIVKAELPEDNHLKLQNSLSEDYEYLRTSLVPSALQNIKDNQGKTEEPFLIYELSNVYLKTSNKLPDEKSNLVIASTMDYLNLKGHLELLLAHLNIKNVVFDKATDAPVYFNNSDTASISVNGVIAGYIGSIKPKILHDFGITSNPVVIETQTERLADAVSHGSAYQPISDYPEVVEQMTVESDLEVGKIMDKIRSVNKLINKIVYTSSFKGKHSFKITFTSFQKNLTQQEVNQIKEEIQELFN